jgi:colanic acid biosynthesis protein WcaH
LLFVSSITDLASAFQRLMTDELGERFNIKQASLLGPYDHFYEDDVFGDTFTTHYVAIAFVLVIDHELTGSPVGVQHGQHQWFYIATLTGNNEVHSNTKNYYYRR